MKSCAPQRNEILPFSFVPDNIHIYSLRDFVNIFLQQISNLGTRNRYFFCFKSIFLHGILKDSFSLSELHNLNLNLRLDCIFKINTLSRSSQQTCAAAFISFFKFLSRLTNNVVNIPIPQKNGIFKTFTRIRKKTVFTPLTMEEIKILIKEAYNHSMRMGLFIEMSLQSTKRLSEILNSTIADVNWGESSIRFFNSKTKEIKESIVSFPSSFCLKLKKMIEEKPQRVFIFETKNGKKVQKDYIWRQFKTIEKRCNFSKKISPHTIRATAITLYRSYGFSLDELMDLTGHSKLEMVSYYDKPDSRRNPSSKVYLI